MPFPLFRIRFGILAEGFIHLVDEWVDLLRAERDVGPPVGAREGGRGAVDAAVGLLREGGPSVEIVGDHYLPLFMHLCGFSKNFILAG